MVSWHCTSCGWLFAADHEEPPVERACLACGRMARLLKDRSAVMELFSPPRQPPPRDGG